jgi:hypothetical protein
MPTQEIKETNWQQFCERFEEAHKGTLISLEVVYHDGTTALLAKNEPLRIFRFQKNAGCSDVIQIELGAAGQLTQHEIVEPIHVRLRDAAEKQKVLEIDAESGSVEMRFSSGRVGAILKDLDLMSPEAMGREGGRTVQREKILKKRPGAI